MVAADVQRLESLWGNPNSVSAADLEWLSVLAEENQAALPVWWLYLRAVQKAESPKFTQVLHRCAAMSPNRDALMSWVETPLSPVKRGEAKEVSITAVEPSLGGKTKEADKIAIDGGPNPGPEPTTLPEPPAIAKPIEAPKVSVPLAPIQPPSASATNAATLNLDALPERVREQILRARAAREQLAKVGFGKAIEPVPANEPPAQVQLVPVDKQPAPVEATPVKAIPEKEEAPKSKPKKAPNSDVESVGPEPSVPADLSPTATTSHLSPFAQFVANLEGSKVTPKGEDLIEQFLASNPKITPLDKNAPAPEVRTEPEGNVTGLVTETLARMYAEQGHVAKAIQAYEILKLRVPEKSSIFAARIEALKSK